MLASSEGESVFSLLAPRADLGVCGASSELLIILRAAEPRRVSSWRLRLSMERAACAEGDLWSSTPKACLSCLTICAERCETRKLFTVACH